MTIKIDSVQITSVRKAGLTIYESLWLGTQKSVRCRYWTGVRIKRVNFRENTWAFCRDRNCPYKACVCIKRASVERGSTVLQKPFKQELKLTKLLFNIFAASLLYTKCLSQKSGGSVVVIEIYSILRTRSSVLKGTTLVHKKVTKRRLFALTGWLLRLSRRKLENVSRRPDF